MNFYTRKDLNWKIPNRLFESQCFSYLSEWWFSRLGYNSWNDQHVYHGRSTLETLSVKPGHQYGLGCSPEAPPTRE